MARGGCCIFSLAIVISCLAIVTCRAPSRKILAQNLDSLENEFKAFKAGIEGIEEKISHQFAEREATMREDFAARIALVERKLEDQIKRVSEETKQRLRQLITDQLDNGDASEEKTIRENGNCDDISNCSDQRSDGVGSEQSIKDSELQTDVKKSLSTATPSSSPSLSTPSSTTVMPTSSPSSTTSSSLSTTSSTTAFPTSATKRISATRGPSEPRNRILISRYFRESRTYFKQYHIDTGKTDTYPNLRGNNILAITYDPTNRRVIFTRDSPSGIFASTLDGNGFTTLLRNVGSEGLFVDEKRELLFFTTFEPNNTISRITTSGNDYRIIASLYNRGFVSPRAVTVDSDREIIYYNFRGRPWSMDFNGNNKVSYSVKEYGSYACGIDAFTNTLYYNDDKLIVKRDMTTGNTTILQTLKEATRNIILYDNTLYMSGWDHGGIYILDLETNEMSLPVKGLTYYDHVIALLP